MDTCVLISVFVMIVSVHINHVHGGGTAYVSELAHTNFFLFGIDC